MAIDLNTNTYWNTKERNTIDLFNKLSKDPRVLNDSTAGMLLDSYAPHLKTMRSPIGKYTLNEMYSNLRNIYDQFGELPTGNVEEGVLFDKVPVEETLTSIPTETSSLSLEDLFKKARQSKLYTESPVFKDRLDSLKPDFNTVDKATLQRYLEAMSSENYDINSDFDQTLIDNLHTKRYNSDVLSKLSKIQGSQDSEIQKLFKELKFDKDNPNQLMGKSREETLAILNPLAERVDLADRQIDANTLLNNAKQSASTAGGNNTPTNQGGFLGKLGKYKDRIFQGKTIWSDEAAPKMAGISNAISGGVQGIQAISNISNNVDTGKNIKDLQSQIVSSFDSNPLAVSSLTADQLSKVRSLKNGYKRGEPNFGDIAGNVVKDIPSIALQTAIGLATGNPVGAVINAVGSVANSGLKGYNQAQQRQMQELENLYATLSQADQEYNAHKRQRILRNSYY